MAKMSQMFVQLCLVVLVGQLVHVQSRSVPNYGEFSYDSHSVVGTFVADPESAAVSPTEAFSEKKFYQPHPSDIYPGDSADRLKHVTPEFNVKGDSDLENSGVKFVDSNVIPAPHRLSVQSFEYDAFSTSKTLPDEFDIPFDNVGDEHRHTKEDYKYDASNKGDGPKRNDGTSFADTTAVGTETPGSKFLKSGGFDYSSTKGSTKPLNEDSELLSVDFTEAN